MSFAPSWKIKNIAVFPKILKISNSIPERESKENKEHSSGVFAQVHIFVQNPFNSW